MSLSIAVVTFTFSIFLSFILTWDRHLCCHNLLIIINFCRMTYSFSILSLFSWLLLSILSLSLFSHTHPVKCISSQIKSICRSGFLEVVVYSAVNIVAHGACVYSDPPHAPRAEPVFDIKGYGSRRAVIVMIIRDFEVWVQRATSTLHPAVSCFLAQNCCGQFFIITSCLSIRPLFVFVQVGFLLLSALCPKREKKKVIHFVWLMREIWKCHAFMFL